MILEKCELQPVAYSIRKRGRGCVVGKTVLAEPLGMPVLATPYRNRPRLDFVSLPLTVIQDAKGRGARLWIVRLDREHVCLCLPFQELRRVRRWIFEPEGPELAVDLETFEPIVWQDWEYVSNVVHFPSGVDHD